jgi:hypothetical protein
VDQQVYEIRALGALPESARKEFKRLRVEQRPVETIVHGGFAGPVALASVLARLDTLGLRVVSYRRLSPSGARATRRPAVD